MAITNTPIDGLADYERDEEGYLVPKPRVYSPMPIAYDEEGYRTDYDQKDEEMSDSELHSRLMRYILDLLSWYYHIENWYISFDKGISQRNAPMVSPDIGVFKDAVIPESERIKKTYRITLPHRPAPKVVFEIASAKTWPPDLEEKPETYRQMGVSEYFTYDPDTPQNWSDTSSRIKGWRYVDGQTIELSVDERGWMWSEELQLYLEPDGALLQFRNLNNERLLTEAVYFRYSRQQAEVEAEAERQAKEAAWAKLRELGINPEDLSKN